MTFFWNRQQLDYFDHPYNHTAQNMRRVEIPIARWFIEKAGPGARILEVGNVLAHYGRVTWPVVDLRERGAINADVMRWRPAEAVDLVVSISTIEHVAAPAAAVLERLRGFLAPGGQVVATAPTAYNAVLDQQLREDKLGADVMWFMRARPRGEWEECRKQEALAMPARACAGRWSGGLMILLCRRGTCQS